MKEYKNENPEFSESIEILETTDTNHADNFNVSTKKLADNTRVLNNRVNEVEKTANEITDDTTGQKYKLGVDNGLVYVEAVEATV